MDLRLYHENKIRVVADFEGDNFMDVASPSNEAIVATFHDIHTDIEVWLYMNELYVIQSKHKPENPFWEKGTLVFNATRRHRKGVKA